MLVLHEDTMKYLKNENEVLLMCDLTMARYIESVFAPKSIQSK